MDINEFFEECFLPKLSDIDDGKAPWDQFLKSIKDTAQHTNSDFFRYALIRTLVNPFDDTREISDQIKEAFYLLTKNGPKEMFLESIEYRSGDDTHEVKYQNYEPES